MSSFLLKYRRVFIVLLHLGLAAASNYLAFWLRFDGRIGPETMAMFWAYLPLLVGLRGLAFYWFRLYEGLWRYTGIWDLRSLLLAVAGSSAAFAVIVRFGLDVVQYPRSVYIVDSLLLVFLAGGFRLIGRLHRELSSARGSKRVLIVGAGDAGEMVVRDMIKNPSYDYEPVGLVDDDARKVGHRIHGVRVLGRRADLPAVLRATNPHEVLVAMPSADPPALRQVVRSLERHKVQITTVPHLGDIIEGRVAVDEIRQLSIEDLLPRVPMGVEGSRVRDLVAGRRVLVTGAGGSIGSELCRQIGEHRPESLVLFERYENSLYYISTELHDRDDPIAHEPAIGDVLDVARLNDVIQEHRPDVVFHAAAHKHVPLMELNVCEAVKNNVIGTRTVARACQEHGVERFILVSTDKAVNPSSVMGATKRVAELAVQGLCDSGPTRLVTVRFGNVLGSNGSVVPRFLEQIKQGGPVTVTHPDIRRFFMLIPEAVQLVLTAAAIGENGSVFVLDMGAQIRVVDIARNLIRLSGFVPDKEIPLEFVGLRPGEKLSEELVGHQETVETTDVEKILRVRTTANLTRVADIDELVRLATAGRTSEVLEQLQHVVPTFGATAADDVVPPEVSGGRPVMSRATV